MRKFKVGFDCDDVLYSCVPYALSLENKKRIPLGLPPLSEKQVTCWGRTGTEVDKMFEYFEDEDFYRTQPLLEDAEKLVNETIAMGHEPFIFTSIDSRFAKIRLERIAQDFPKIPKSNIFISQRKDLFCPDVMFDDGMHNLVGDYAISAKYPVLFRKAWNKDTSGIFSVSSYVEFLDLLKRLSDFSPYENDKLSFEHKLVCFVGPTGSGKTQIINELEKHPLYSRIRTVTTNPKANSSYEIVSAKEFSSIDFVEQSEYNGFLYGIRTSVIEKIWANGMNAITSVDIAGACSLKRIFGSNVIIAFCKRNTGDIIQNILARNISAEEKVSRISAINLEFEGEKIADIILSSSSVSKNIADVLCKINN